MKFIHTSDWHLGHSLYGADRTGEQSSMLSQIEEIVRLESPDALIVSGDIYHTGVPSATVQRIFTEAVLRIHAACPGMVVVITAGNHDSAAKHTVSKVLWETQNVHMVSYLTDGPVIEVPGKGWIAAVPYINERSMPEGLFQTILDDIAGRNADGLPVVLSAHLTVRGSDFAGHEDVRNCIVGGIEGVDLAALGSGYDYAALGHIHHGQAVLGSGGRVRYSGTPIPVSFDEKFAHGVSVVEIASHGAAPKVREVEIKNPRPLVNIPADGFAPWDEVKAKATDFPKDKPCYVRLNVEVDDCLPSDAKDEAMSIFAGGEARFCLVNARRKAAEGNSGKALTVSEFQAMEPLEVARLYASETARTFGDDLEKLFMAVADEVKNASRNQ